ncbi:MAG TPA: hypothetical protein VF777_08055 [Phycisphaerales bacterium]
MTAARSNLRPAALLALAAGVAVASPHSSAQLARTWGNVSGVWSNPTNWSPTDIPNSPPEKAVLTGAGVYTAALDVPVQLVGVDIINANATLAMNAGTVLAIGTAGLNTGLANSGTLLVNASGAGVLTQLRFPVPTTISGTGLIRLNADPGVLDSAFISPDFGGSWTHAAGHTIAGAGRLYGPFANAGNITADAPGRVLQIAGDITNSGVVAASTGILELAQGSRLVGGLLSANAGTLVRVADVAGLSAMQVAGQVDLSPGSVLELGGSITGTHTFRVNPAAALANTQLVAAAALSLDGAGAIVLSANASDLESAALLSSAGPITTSLAMTIRGSGRVYAPLTGAPVVRADQAGSTLELLNDCDMTGGGSLAVTAANAVLALGSGTITSGSLAGGPGKILVNAFQTPTLTATSTSGTIETLPGSRVFVSGNLANNATLRVNTGGDPSLTGLRFLTSSTISGTGSIFLRASSAAELDSALISAAPGATITNALGHTIRGKGRISAPIINDGVIQADDPAAPIEIRSAVTNTGGIGATNATLQLAGGASISGGTLASFGTGSVSVAPGETATITDVINEGLINALPGSILRIAGAGVENNSVLAINPTSSLIPARLRAAANTNLTGSGSLLLSANPANLDTAVIDAPPSFVLTNGPTHTITGQGRILAAITNQGVIQAGGVGLALEIGSPITQTTGVLRTAQGRLALLSGASITGGTIDQLPATTGHLTIDGGASITNASSTAPIEVLAGRTLTITAFTNNSDVLVNPTSAAGTTRVVAPGVQTLLGTGTITLGATTQPETRARFEAGAGVNLLTFSSGQILRGSGSVSGRVLFEGSIAPGVGTTPGRIIFENPPLLLPTTTLDFDLASGVLYDSIAIKQPYTLGGTLRVTLLNGFNPVGTNLFTIIDGDPAATRTGGFDSFQLPPVPPSPIPRVWRLNYQAQDVTLRLTCQADFNADGLVDDTDFQYFVVAYDEVLCPSSPNPNFPNQPDPCPADLNADDLVNDDDFVLFAAAYNLILCQ